MKLFIPPLGTILTLTKKWTFELHNEERNVSLFRFLGDDTPAFGHRQNAQGFGKPGEKWPPKRAPRKSITASLPKGTKLRVDRYYIRAPFSEFDSVTFTLDGARTEVDRVMWMKDRWVSDPKGSVTKFGGGKSDRGYYLPPSKKKVKSPVRFWVKLADVNTMEVR